MAEARNLSQVSIQIGIKSINDEQSSKQGVILYLSKDESVAKCTSIYLNPTFEVGRAELN